MAMRAAVTAWRKGSRLWRALAWHGLGTADAYGFS